MRDMLIRSLASLGLAQPARLFGIERRSPACDRAQCAIDRSPIGARPHSPIRIVINFAGCFKQHGTPRWVCGQYNWLRIKSITNISFITQHPHLHPWTSTDPKIDQIACLRAAPILHQKRSSKEALARA
jgi:hypothetical protein